MRIDYCSKRVGSTAVKGVLMRVRRFWHESWVHHHVSSSNQVTGAWCSHLLNSLIEVEHGIADAVLNEDGEVLGTCQHWRAEGTTRVGNKLELNYTNLTFGTDNINPYSGGCMSPSRGHQARTSQVRATLEKFTHLPVWTPETRVSLHD